MLRGMSGVLVYRIVFDTYSVAHIGDGQVRLGLKRRLWVRGLDSCLGRSFPRRLRGRLE